MAKISSSHPQSSLEPSAMSEPSLDPVPMPDVQAVAKQRRSPDRPGIKPSFKTLIGLTFLTALLLLPFAFSAGYLDALRNNSVDLHQFLRGEWYKQGTGFGAFAFVILELMLTMRKRGRGWLVSVKLPGSVQLWRSFHIFVGVALVGMVLIHTVGANGLNFNAIFLWVFWGVTLTALMGVVAETGILESTRRQFGKLPWSKQPLFKGPLVRNLRSLWLLSHIFLVCVFSVMLIFHIALAYYFQ